MVRKVLVCIGLAALLGLGCNDELSDPAYVVKLIGHSCSGGEDCGLLPWYVDCVDGTCTDMCGLSSGCKAYANCTYGQPTGHGFWSCISTYESCKNHQDCYGDCTTADIWCPPNSECISISTGTNEVESPCKEDGHCAPPPTSFFGCEPSDLGCLQSDQCSDWGNCSVGGGEWLKYCTALDDADCAGSKGCLDYGKCTAIDGWCEKDPNADCCPEKQKGCGTTECWVECGWDHYAECTVMQFGDDFCSCWSCSCF